MISNVTLMDANSKARSPNVKISELNKDGIFYRELIHQIQMMPSAKPSYSELNSKVHSPKESVEFEAQKIKT